MDPSVLEKYRKKKKITKTELCELMGMTGGWYSRIATGEVTLKEKYIPQLSEILGIKPQKLAREYFSGVRLEDTAS